AIEASEALAQPRPVTHTKTRQALAVRAAGAHRAVGERRGILACARGHRAGRRAARPHGHAHLGAAEAAEALVTRAFVVVGARHAANMLCLTGALAHAVAVVAHRALGVGVRRHATPRGARAARHAADAGVGGAHERLDSRIRAHAADARLRVVLR